MEPMPCRWYYKRLFSIIWYFHVVQGNLLNQAVCVHRRNISQNCEQCFEHEVPDNYFIEYGYPEE